jgi:hypothetical protein
MLNEIRDHTRQFIYKFYCHRVLYAGLALCHLYFSILADTVEHDGPLAVFYVLLALKR